MKSAKQIFESELKKRSIVYEGPDKADNYKLKINDYYVNVNIGNISKNYTRDKDERIVINFIDQTLNFIEIPPWNKAKELIYFSAEASDYSFGDTIHYKITDSLSKVLVITDINEGKITWVTNGMIKDWKITLKDAETSAANNMIKLLENVKIEYLDIDGMKLGMVPIESVFKASTIFL